LTRLFSMDERKRRKSAGADYNIIMYRTKV